MQNVTRLFKLMWKVIKSIKDLKGVKVGRRNINNLMFADDATLIAESEENLQDLLNT